MNNPKEFHRMRQREQARIREQLLERSAGPRTQLDQMVHMLRGMGLQVTDEGK